MTKISVTRAARREAREQDALLRNYEPVRISERRTLSPGDRAKITGVRGEWTYQYQLRSDESLTFVGGVKGEKRYRSFMSDKVKRILR